MAGLQSPLARLGYKWRVLCGSGLAVLALLVAAAGASATGVVKQFGTTAPGDSWGCPGANFKYGNEYALADNGTVTSITAYMKGNGGGGSQVFETMVYAADGASGAPGTLLATSQAVTVSGDAAPGAVSFPISPGVHLVAGNYWLAQISGPSDAQACLSGTGTALNSFNSDAYDDGPSNPFTASGPLQSSQNLWTLSATYTVDSDTTAPVITGTPVPAANANGWNNTPVTVTFSCTDEAGGSGVAAASVSAPVTLSSEGAGQSASGSCSDNAGNPASTTVSNINIDKTAPSVVYSGGGTYTLQQNVAITCTASDALSGVASSTCANLSGPAWSFGGGSHALSATATDKAGNTGSGSSSFTVAVTPSTLCGLTLQFIQGSANYQRLKPIQRLMVGLLSGIVCEAVDSIVPKLSPARAAALVSAYKSGLGTLVSQGWLTSAQGATLSGLTAYVGV